MATCGSQGIYYRDAEQQPCHMGIDLDTAVEETMRSVRVHGVAGFGGCSFAGS